MMKDEHLWFTFIVGFFLTIIVSVSWASWNYGNIRRIALENGYCEVLSPGRLEPVWSRCP